MVDNKVTKPSWVSTCARIISRLGFDPLMAGILLAAIVNVFFILSNYANCFQDAEAMVWFTPAALEKGASFSRDDFANIFNVWGFDNGWNRPRFLSYTFYIIAIKTRLLLWNLMPPHPSLSVVWLFSLILAPIMLFKYLRLILKDTTAALAGVAVYISACGYLSSGTMMFHPGKPLLNVIVIALLFLIARDAPAENPDRRNPGFVPSVFYGVLPLLTASLFLDEMAIFCFLILPIWSPRYFFPYRFDRKNIIVCAKNILFYLIPAGILLIMVLAVTPAIAKAAFGKTFDFFGCIQHNLRLEQLTPGFLAGHFFTFFSASLVPWGILKLRFPAPEITGTADLLGAQIFYAVAVLFTAYLFIKNKTVVFARNKILTLLVVFVLAQSFNISFHIQRIPLTGYYYGAVFSVMFASLSGLVILLLREKVRFGRLLAPVILGYVVVMQSMNFLVINNSWRIHSDWKMAVSIPSRDLNTIKGRVVALIARKLRNDIGWDYKSSYIRDNSPVDPKAKRDNAVRIWQAWRQGKCDLFSEKHDLMFLQDLWLFGELCPDKFKDFH